MPLVVFIQIIMKSFMKPARTNDFNRCCKRLNKCKLVQTLFVVMRKACS